MVTYAIDNKAYELLKNWADGFMDLVFRFGDDISPRFNNARILYQYKADEALDIRFSVDHNKTAYLYIPSADSPAIRFSIKSTDEPSRICKFSSSFKRTGTFYQDIAHLFCMLNAFVLYDRVSSAARKAFGKSSLNDFDKYTFFTIRKTGSVTYLDTCKAFVEDEKLIVK